MPTPITKGCTVYRNVNSPELASNYGRLYTVTQVRKNTSRWHTFRLVKLAGDNSFVSEQYLTHSDDVTPEQRAAFAAHVATYDAEEAAAAEKKRQDEQKKVQHERGVLKMFADKLRAKPEVLTPLAHIPADPDSWASGRCEATIRYWVQSGRGYDTKVAQREERIGVDIRRDVWSDPVTGRRRYVWGVGVGGTTYDTFRAKLIADAVTLALSIIPTLPDPTPSYDRV